MPYTRLSHGGGAVDTTLNANITNSDASLVLNAATGWPDGSAGPFWIVIGVGLATEEKVLVTARTGTSLTGLSRGSDGTAASAHTAGETIQHCFTATEADEANLVVNKTIGAVTTKGDMIVGTASQTLGKLAAGSDGLPLVAASGQSTGLQYAALTATGLATGAVTSAAILDGTVTGTDIAATTITASNIVAGTITGTQIANGTVTSANILDGTIATADIAAGAITNPLLAAGAVGHSNVSTGFWQYGLYSTTLSGSNDATMNHGATFTPSIILLTPVSPSGGANQGYPLVTNITATQFTVRYLNTAGAMAGVAVTGYFLALP